MARPSLGCARALVLALLACTLVLASGKHDKLFEKFKAQYKRVYDSPEEERYRYGVFVSNMERVEAYNEANPFAEFGVTQFADKTHAELFPWGDIRKRFPEKADGVAGTRRKKRVLSDAEVQRAVGKKIDWRTKGAVTDVKNQANCGGCWAFAAAAASESQWFLAGNTLVSLSPQMFISCVSVDDGCNGGFPHDAYEWALEANNGRIATWGSYPFADAAGNTSPCNPGRDYITGAVISGYYMLPHSEDQMAAFVYSGGPIAVGIDATTVEYYKSGIITQCISEQVDHAVTVVGFDDWHTPPYWIIKNSWAASFGEDGYFRIVKGTDECLITTLPSVPYIGEPDTTVTQQTCSDNECQFCESVVIEQDECHTGLNSSYIARCTGSGLVVRMFNNTGCAGEGRKTIEPTNQCALFNTQSMTLWSQNTCPATKKRFAMQSSCTDARCSKNCETQSFLLDRCLAASPTSSNFVTCNSSAVVIKTFAHTGDCSGDFAVTSMALEQCFLSENGFITNVCNTIDTE